MTFLSMASYCHRDRELSVMGAQASDRSKTCPYKSDTKSRDLCDWDKFRPGPSSFIDILPHALAVLREESAKRRIRKARARLPVEKARGGRQTLWPACIF